MERKLMEFGDWAERLSGASGLPSPALQEALLRSILEDMPSAVYLKDADGRYVLVNRAWEALTGLPASEVEGRRTGVVFQQELAARFQAEDERILRTNEPTMFEQNVRLHGEDRTFLNVSFPVRDREGHPYRVCGVSTDITARKATERALAESEERYRLLFENTLDAVLLTQADGAVLDANPAACRMFGLGIDDLRRAGRSGLVDPSDPKLASALEERQRTGRFSGELRLRHRDGSAFPAHLSSVVFRDGRGRECTCMVVRDLSEERRAQEALRLSEETFRGAFENAAIGMAVIAPDGRLLRINRAFQRMLGYNEAALREKTFAEVTHPEDRDGGLEVFRELLRGTRSSAILEKRYLHRNGSVIWTRLAAAAIRSPSGELLHLVSQIEDITAQREAEAELAERASQVRRLGQQLREIEQEERRRLAEALHDQVGQKLSALGLNLQLLQTRLKEVASDLDRQRFQDCQVLLDEIGAHTRDVMAELRPQSLEDYGLRAGLRGQAQVFTQRSGIPCQVVGAEFSPRLPPEAEVALFRIAQEALANVAKHARATEVIAGLEELAGGCRLTIADDGIGFLPGGRGGEGNGTGWGLCLMAERAEAVGGHVRVETSPGAGTRVIAEVPR